MSEEPTPEGGRDRTPLWRHVRDDLRARLEQGEFGDSFPGEMELAKRYEVSRHTVRAALRDLRQEGLVTAARGRRPRAAGEAVIEQPVGAVYSLFASVEAAGLEQRSIVRALDVRADAHVAVRLGMEESTPLLYLERIRLADGEPLAHDKVWMLASDARALLDVDFGHTALYDELAVRCGIRLVGGEEHIKAVTPTAAEQKLLGLPDGVAAFSIERLGRTHGRTVEWRTTLIRGDRFSVVARFDARTGYRLDPAPAPFTRPRRSLRGLDPVL
ncbi:GntR family transcriptional regulator [Streptomyces longispororuber]|uniref:GntR family transcriptional regulator n=1 Tax=Streptomyces longispororuber TaxID=68230 RepID=UPI00210B7737|nr:GntR family transcriptional regulator [Streptomyces longispororuber]MCQ4209666.1 GntR family transcriptional regulator [Streptomyces longispororuber]